MLSDSLHQKLNDQLNFELESAYVYFSMAAYMDSLSLDGFASWMKLQAQEEVGHAMRIYNYLNDRGKAAMMLAIKQPPTEFKNVLDVFNIALGHEEKLAARLNTLSQEALTEKDNTTYTFLEWFLTEQVEEVSTVSTICDKLKMIGDNGYGVLMLSNELGLRKPEPEAQ